MLPSRLRWPCEVTSCPPDHQKPASSGNVRIQLVVVQQPPASGSAPSIPQYQVITQAPGTGSVVIVQQPSAVGSGAVGPTIPTCHPRTESRTKHRCQSRPAAEHDARKHCDRLHHTNTVIRVEPLMGIVRRTR
jgi:hypothetical protein